MTTKKIYEMTCDRCGFLSKHADREAEAWGKAFFWVESEIHSYRHQFSLCPSCSKRALEKSPLEVVSEWWDYCSTCGKRTLEKPGPLCCAGCGQVHHSPTPDFAAIHHQAYVEYYCQPCVKRLHL